MHVILSLTQRRLEEASLDASLDVVEGVGQDPHGPQVVGGATTGRLRLLQPTHTNTLLFYSLVNVQVAVCPLEVFWSCWIVYLMNCEGGRAAPITEQPTAHVTTEGGKTV